jgi:hypothetical protein
MKMLRMIPLALCAMLFCSILTPGAKADEWNKKTIVTFETPVQIPGQTLQPGTYVFEVMTPFPRNAVQIWDKNQDHLIATILTIPDDQGKTNDDSVFFLLKNTKLIRRATPQSTLTLQSWFYAGDMGGRMFTYPNYPAMETP